MKEIAIIGMQGRLPGAPRLDDFWRNLRGAVESIAVLDDEVLRASGVPEERMRDPRYVRAAAVIEGEDEMDAALFGMSPAEAELLDPQHRVFLEAAWEALEHAGHDPARFEGLIGVYAGAAMNTYAHNYLLDGGRALDVTESYAVMLGNDKDFLPTRVSYELDLKGPSVNVQTACSTSLVAVHLACQALLAGECDMALAGGVSIVSPQRTGYLHRPGMILSPDGHCRAFDAAAQGIVGGNGVGLVVLRRLSDALADGDTVYAVIKGSAINNDGGRKVGFTAPSVDAQADVIAEAHAVAGVSPASISYVEAHGTGTPIGDPIEVAALTQAFLRAGKGRRATPCALGSVKTNIGHLNTAAGVAGLLKAVLAVMHGEIPPTLHCERPNPAIDWDRAPFRVASRLEPWQVPVGEARRAGVSSFGIGGTNAHVIVEQAPPVEPAPAADDQWRLLVLSARGEKALEEAGKRLAARLSAEPAPGLGDVAFTLALGRRELEHRRFVVCRTREQAADLLAQPWTGEKGPGAAQKRPVAFMFSGQGSQYAGMARELYQSDPVIKEHVDRCASLLERRLGLDLREVMFAPSPGGDERLRQTDLAQPALFVIEYALARRWMKWGVEPQVMLGHSVGEYVAACLAGVFRLEDALALIAERGRLMQGLPRGAMLAVALPERDVSPLLDSGLSLAAVNGPTRCVVSGEIEAVERLRERLSERGVASVPLHTSHAFHSRLCEPILPAFRERVAAVQRRPPAIPFLSNLTGRLITAEQAMSPDYWASHIRGTVRFSEGLEALLSRPEQALIEVGPGRTLATLAGEHPGCGEGRPVVSSTRHPREAGSDTAFLLRSLGRLWQAGVRVDWPALFEGEARRRTALPCYPFQRSRFSPPLRAGSDVPVKRAGGALARSELDAWLYARSWERAPAPGRAGERREVFLLCAYDSGIAAHLESLLSARGHTVVTALAGASFEQSSARSFRVNPASPDEMSELFRRIHADAGWIDRVVYGWSAGAALACAQACFTEVDQTAFMGLLHVGRALGALLAREAGSGAAPRSVELSILTAGLCAVTGDERLHAGQAMITGPALVLPQEYPGLVCRQIDVDADRRGDRPAQSLAAHLFAELVGRGDEPLVALRGKHAFRPVIRPIPPEELPERTAGPRSGAGAPLAARPSIVRPGAVILITGGLGGVGLALARHLARRRGARLILTGRTALPARDLWDEHVAARGPSERVSRAIAEVRALEAEGAEVLVMAADVTSREQMRAVVAEGRRRFGAIHGVIHAAGAVLRGAVEHETALSVARGTAAKVQGAVVLGELFEDEPLDFMALCSSLAAIFGGVGLAGYVAANAFLDAFAERRASERPGKTISIGWDGWHEIGSAAPGMMSEAERQVRAAAMGVRGIDAEEGAEAFERALGGAGAHVLVSLTDLPERLARERAASAAARAGAAQGADVKPEAAAGGGRARHPRPDLATSYVAPRDPTEQALAGALGEVLGLERVGVLDGFFELGASSLAIVQALGALRAALREVNPAAAEALRVSDFFEHPNIDSLSRRFGPARSEAEAASVTQGSVRERAMRQQQAMASERARTDRRRERERNG